MTGPVKARLLDDDAFRVLAIPFTGPIPSPTHPGGVDLDGETFTPDTDIKPDWWTSRAVDWHHGQDRTMGRHVIGKATDLAMEDDGWWVTVWLNHGDQRRRLITRLQEAGAVLYGSSEPVHGMVKVKADGAIEQWPYWRQTLSTSPQNTHSILTPMKADLDDVLPGDYAPSVAFWDDLKAQLDDLDADLAGAMHGREPVADIAAQVERLEALLARRA